MPNQNSVLINYHRMRFCAIRRHGFAVKVRSILPDDFMQLQRDLNHVPLPFDIERQVASNHGLASIVDPVYIPRGVDALYGISGEVQKNVLLEFRTASDPLAH